MLSVIHCWNSMFMVPLDLATVGAALSCRTRCHMMALISQEPRTVTELARLSGVQQPSGSYHVRLLCEAGLVQVETRGNCRLVSPRAKVLRLVLGGRTQHPLEPTQ